MELMHTLITQQLSSRYEKRQHTLPIGCQRTISHNKTFDKQLRFFSTKKKTTKKKKVLTKPTLADKAVVLDLLDEQEVTICRICFKEDDECEEYQLQYMGTQNMCQIQLDQH